MTTRAGLRQMRLRRWRAWVWAVVAGTAATTTAADPAGPLVVGTPRVSVPPVPTLPPLPAVPAAPTVPTRTQPDDPTPPADGNGNGKDKPNGNGTRVELSPAVGTPYTLGECIAIGMERQPALKAARQSLMSAQLGQQSLCNIHQFTTLLVPDLPARRQQAARGVAVAEAEVRKVEQDVVYDVTRLYWSYVYARQQEITANDVIEQLEVFYRVLEDILNAGVPDPKMKLNQFTLYNLRNVIDEVRRKRVDAVAGQPLALAALREAMGLDPSVQILPKATDLPVMGGTISREQAIEFAVARRAEVAQAAAGWDAFKLEVEAQDARRRSRQVPTLAAGADLHSRAVPQALRNGDYRPGAVAPEMPTGLVGRRDDRVARAASLAERQGSVYEKAVNLVRLEAENTFLQWQAATDRVKVTKAKLDNARTMVEQARTATAAKQDPELVVRAEALAGQAQAEYLEAVFAHIKALATLERVTAGAVRPAFPGR